MALTLAEAKQRYFDDDNDDDQQHAPPRSAAPAAAHGTGGYTGGLMKPSTALAGRSYTPLAAKHTNPTMGSGTTKSKPVTNFRTGTAAQNGRQTAVHRSAALMQALEEFEAADLNMENVAHPHRDVASTAAAAASSLRGTSHRSGGLPSRSSTFGMTGGGYQQGSLLAAVRNPSQQRSTFEPEKGQSAISFMEQYAAGVSEEELGNTEKQSALGPRTGTAAHLSPTKPGAADDDSHKHYGHNDSSGDHSKDETVPPPLPAKDVGTLSALNLSDLTAVDPTLQHSILHHGGTAAATATATKEATSRHVDPHRVNQEVAAAAPHHGQSSNDDETTLRRIREQRLEVAKLTRSLLQNHPAALFQDLFRPVNRTQRPSQLESADPPSNQDHTQNPAEAPPEAVDPITQLPPPPPADWLRKIHRDQVETERQRAETDRLDRVMADLAQQQRLEGPERMLNRAATEARAGKTSHHNAPPPTKLDQIQCQVMLSYILQAASTLEEAAQQKVTRDTGVGPTPVNNLNDGRRAGGGAGDISAVHTPGMTPVDSLMIGYPPHHHQHQQGASPHGMTSMSHAQHNSLGVSQISHLHLGGGGSPIHNAHQLSLMMSPHEAQLIASNAQHRRHKQFGGVAAADISSGGSGNKSSSGSKKSQHRDESSFAGRTSSSSPPVVPPLQLNNSVHTRQHHHGKSGGHNNNQSTTVIHSDDDDDDDEDESPTNHGFHSRGNARFPHESTMMTVGGPTTASGINTSGAMTGHVNTNSASAGGVVSSSSSHSRSHTPASQQVPTSHDGSNAMILPNQKPPQTPTVDHSAPPSAAATARAAGDATPPPAAKGPNTPRVDSARKPPTPRSKPAAKPKKKTGFFSCFAADD